MVPAHLRIFHYGDAWYALNARTLFRAQRLAQPFQTVADVIRPEIAGQLDPVKLGEPGAVADRPKIGADRYSIRHVGVDIFNGRLLVYFSCVDIARSEFCVPLSTCKATRRNGGQRRPGGAAPRIGA